MKALGENDPDTSGEQYAKRQKTSEAQADHTPEPLPDTSVSVGDPLPAHKLILCGGSPRFRAQVERWVVEQGYGTKPVLRVPLGDADEHPHALGALKFMYTGKVDAADISRILRMRRQAAYLQVEGCADACDKALLASIAGLSSAGQQQQPGGTLAAMVELYNCRDLLADVEQPVPHSLLRACREQLVVHVGSIPAGQVTLTPGGPTLGELLAWAFEDAPSLLNNPESLQQMQALPVAAMEALLGCDSFPTDDEATVLLMLMHWLEKNRVHTAVQQQLVKLVRLCQLNSTYLLRVLPLMPSCGIGRRELRFLQDFERASESKRKRLLEDAGTHCDIKSGWYLTTPRPASPHTDVRTYEWHLDASQLKAAIGAEMPGNVIVNGTFSNGAKSVVANGVEWYPQMALSCLEVDAVGAYLMCSAPACLQALLTHETPVLLNPGSCRLVVYKWAGGGASREEGWSFKYGPTEDIQVGSGRGYRSAIPLVTAATSKDAASPPSSAAQRLAKFDSYVKDGKLWGALEWSSK